MTSSSRYGYDVIKQVWRVCVTRKCMKGSVLNSRSASVFMERGGLRCQTICHLMLDNRGLKTKKYEFVTKLVAKDPEHIDEINDHS